jgi:hypothetical protein
MQHPGLIAILCALTLLWLWCTRPLERMTRAELRAKLVFYLLLAKISRLAARLLGG